MTLVGDLAVAPLWIRCRVWDYWYLLLLPLCPGVSMVYKSIKCDEHAAGPARGGGDLSVDDGGLVAAALAFWVMVKLVIG